MFFPRDGALRAGAYCVVVARRRAEVDAFARACEKPQMFVVAFFECRTFLLVLTK